MFKINKKFDFEAAHRIPNHPKCGKLHGHTYFGEISVYAETLDEMGFVVDFARIKEVTNQYDHSDEIIELSAEQLAMKILDQVAHLDERIVGVDVLLHETKNSYAYVEWKKNQ